jgi:hypothetical protein
MSNRGSVTLANSEPAVPERSSFTAASVFDEFSTT